MTWTLCTSLISPPTTSSLPSPQLTKPNHTSLFLFYSKLLPMLPERLTYWKSYVPKMVGSSLGLRVQLKGQTNSTGPSLTICVLSLAGLSPPIFNMLMVLFFSQMKKKIHLLAYFFTFSLFQLEGKFRENMKLSQTCSSLHLHVQKSLAHNSNINLPLEPCARMNERQCRYSISPKYLLLH